MKRPSEITKRFFESDEAFLKVGTLVFGGLAFFKGVQMPNLWSATQAQIDYRDGFVKRGLFGSTLKNAFHLNAYNHFAIFSFLVLLVASALLLRTLWTSGMMTRVTSGAGIAVFASSIAVTTLSSLVGYIDILQLALTLAVLQISKPSLRYFPAILVCAICPFLHESFLLLFLPLLLFSFFLDFLAGRLAFRWLILFLSSLVIITMGLTVVIASKASMSVSQMATLGREIKSSVDFPVNVEVFDVLKRSTPDNLKIMFSLFRTSYYWSEQLSALLMFLPPAIFIAYLLRLFLQKIKRVEMVSIIAAVAVATLAPLVLHLLGWDVVRWYAFSLIAFVTTFSLVVRSYPGIEVPISPVIRNICFLVIALNIASGEVLMDNSGPNLYPYLYTTVGYLSHVHHLHSILPTR